VREWGDFEEKPKVEEANPMLQAEKLYEQEATNNLGPRKGALRLGQ